MHNIWALYSKRDLALLQKVREGLAASAMTPRWAKEYFRQNSHR
jgi:hypothetical protein